jgi:hypothetical protein
MRQHTHTLRECHEDLFELHQVYVNLCLFISGLNFGNVTLM